MKHGLTRRGGLKAIAATFAMLGTRAAAAVDAATGPRLELRLAEIGPGIVRISLLPVVDGVAVEPEESGSLAEREWPAPTARMTIGGSPQTLRCGGLTFRIGSDPLSITVTDATGARVQEFGLEGGALSFELGDSPLLGLGQGGPHFDRRGAFDEMKSGAGGYQLATHGSRVPIQWLVGTGGWAMFIHQPVGSFDMTGARGRFTPTVSGGPLDLFLVASREPAELMRAYAEITGYPEMPPLWSFGYQQSHRTLGTPAEVIAEAREFRARKLPCDAMIYLGTGFAPAGWNSYNGEFDWNPRVFPNPAASMAALKAENFKVVIHVALEGRRLTGRVSDPCTAPPLPSGRLPDGRWPPDRQVSCYWPFHKPLTDLGVDGWWPDQGDGLDPPSRLARNRMYFEGQQLYRPDKRVYALHRNGFAGMQRFAAFLWSGDVESRWVTLATHVPIAINTAISGIPYWGTDIGGFQSRDEFTGELYARWFQFSAFTPLFRSHGRDWRMHLPWGWTKGERGFPETAQWNPDPADLRDERVEPICRQYLELRYRLLPYLYTAVHECVSTGMPIVRSLWFHHDEPEAVSRGDQYLFGPHLLVAPVVERGATQRRLYLPKGRWIDFWTGEAVEGGREIDRAVDLATMPLYVRAGAVVPLGPVKQHTGERSDEPITLLVHPGADGDGDLYEDDGDSFAYRRGDYRRFAFRWSDADRTLHVRQSHGPASPRTFAVRVVGDERIVPLTLENGQATLQL
jgi:alpha-glucosidase/alpha-D-xyloside xylohydrolase